MAHSRGIIESAQEFLHSSKLSGVSNRGGSSLLRFALPKGQKATFDLRSRRSGIRGGGGRSARTPVAGENGGSRSSIREGPQGETPVASGLYAKIYGLIDARFGDLAFDLHIHVVVFDRKRGRQVHDRRRRRPRAGDQNAVGKRHFAGKKQEKQKQHR